MKAQKNTPASTKPEKNSISLAGEFAVLSQLHAHGYDASLTLGNTKGVDILIWDSVSKPNRMFRLEVKTVFREASKRAFSRTRFFGETVCEWPMGAKHEQISDKDLFYCFVLLNAASGKFDFRFFILPSNVVARYVAEQHRNWLDADGNHNDSKMRNFRIGLKAETYRIFTPTVEQYENKWDLRSS